MSADNKIRFELSNGTKFKVHPSFTGDLIIETKTQQICIQFDDFLSFAAWVVFKKKCERLERQEDWEILLGEDY